MTNGYQSYYVQHKSGIQGLVGQIDIEQLRMLVQALANFEYLSRLTDTGLHTNKQQESPALLAQPGAGGVAGGDVPVIERIPSHHEGLEEDAAAGSSASGGTSGEPGISLMSPRGGGEKGGGEEWSPLQEVRLSILCTHAHCLDAMISESNLLSRTANYLTVNSICTP